MAWSPIQPKKQGNRKNSGVGVKGDREVGGGWTKFEKRGVDNIVGGLQKIGGLAPFCKLSKQTKKIPHLPIIKPTPNPKLERQG